MAFERIDLTGEVARKPAGNGEAGLVVTTVGNGSLLHSDVAWIWITANCLVGITWVAVVGRMVCLLVLLYPSSVQDGAAN